MAVRTQIQGRMRGLQKHCTTAPPDLARLQVGSYAYLKNFRKGLQHQRERCERELAEAKDARDVEKAIKRNDRLRWIHQKQDFLDRDNEMVWDMPVMQDGIEVPFGSLDPAARRELTDEEIGWNAQMIEDERLSHHARRGSASAASVSRRQRPVALRPATTTSKCARPITRPQTSP